MAVYLGDEEVGFLTPIATSGTIIADTTATAQDVVDEKIFYTADGTRTIGAATYNAQLINLNSGSGIEANVTISSNYVTVRMVNSSGEDVAYNSTIPNGIYTISTFPASSFTVNGTTYSQPTALSLNGNVSISVADLTPSEGLNLTLSDDETYYIVGTGYTSISAITGTYSGGVNGSGVGTWAGGQLIIPNEYNGLPVRAIAPSAFNSVYGITSVIIPDNVTVIGNRCFQMPTTLTEDDTDLTWYRLPPTLEYLGCPVNAPDSGGGRVWWGRKGLTDGPLPKTYTTVPISTFSYINGFTDIIVPEHIIVIGSNAYQQCPNLTSITIPEGVTQVGYQCFVGCTSLTTITVKAKTPPTVYNGTFPSDTVQTIYVPQGTSSAYEASNWATSGATFVEMSE